MNTAEKKDLQIAACKIRMGAIEGVYHAKSGHPGGSLSAADVLTYLYFKEMRVDPTRSRRTKTGIVLCSQRGIAAPALYAALALKGLFPGWKSCKRCAILAPCLQGHPEHEGHSRH